MKSPHTSTEAHGHPSAATPRLEGTRDVLDVLTCGIVRTAARETKPEMGTTQSVIARLESGKRPPSLRTVQRYAEAVGGRVVVRIEPASGGRRRHRASAAAA